MPDRGRLSIDAEQASVLEDALYDYVESHKQWRAEIHAGPFRVGDTDEHDEAIEVGTPLFARIGALRSRLEGET